MAFPFSSNSIFDETLLTPDEPVSEEGSREDLLLGLRVRRRVRLTPCSSFSWGVQLKVFIRLETKILSIES